jgi:hypothetical protein
MPRIRPVERQSANPAQAAAYDDTVSAQGRITNMKRTLLHSIPAFRALMEWYPLRDTVQPFLGERLTTIFARAISADTDCLICTTFSAASSSTGNPIFARRPRAAGRRLRRCLAALLARSDELTPVLPPSSG